MLKNYFCNFVEQSYWDIGPHNHYTSRTPPHGWHLVTEVSNLA